jgi:hypothetical protein
MVIVDTIIMAIGFYVGVKLGRALINRDKDED